MTINTDKLIEGRSGRAVGYRISLIFSRAVYEVWLYQYWPFIRFSRFI
jgi:hypothetical protein